MNRANYDVINNLMKMKSPTNDYLIFNNTIHDLKPHGDHPNPAIHLPNI